MKGGIAHPAAALRRVWLLALLAWLCCAAGGARAQAGNATPAPPQPMVIAQAPHEALLLWQHLQVHLNRDGAIGTPGEAQAAFMAGGPQVVRPQRPEHEFGRRNRPIWARFSLHNTSPHALAMVLALRYPTIEHLALWQRPAGSAAPWQRVAGRHESARRAFERDRFPTFELGLPARAQVEYMVEMRTLAPRRLVLSLQAPRSFAVEQRRHDWVLGFGYTVPLSVLLLIASFARLGGTPGLVPFMGLAAADLVATTWIIGFAAQLLPQVPGEVLRTVGYLAYTAMLFFGPRHALSVGGAEAHSPWLRTAAQVLSYGGAAALGVLQFTVPEFASSLPGAMGLVMALLCATMALQAGRRGVPYAYAYFAAWLAYVGTTLLYFFVRLEIWPLEVLPMLLFGQSLALTLIMGQTVARAIVDRDNRLRNALVQAEAQRRQIEAMGDERERLFAAASHDLRQPLQAIAINVELLQHRHGGAAPSQDGPLLDAMQAALVGTHDLLNSLLDLRLDTFGQQPVAMQPLALAPLLQRLGAEYRSVASTRGLMLRVAPTRAWVCADAQRLERVLRNLLANAVRYTEQGWVLVGVRHGPTGRVRVQVVDTGIGIDPPQAGLLFGEHVRGHQAEGADAVSQAGYGLGLYIARRLSAAIGATVRVRPRTADWRRGTVFEVELARAPTGVGVAEAPPLPHAAQVAAAPRDRPLHGLQVLLVDDDPAARTALAGALAELGAGVRALSRPTPQELLQAARGCHAAVCDHDLGLPTSGLELLSLLPTAMTRVLLCGRPARTIRADAAARGVTMFAKPASLARLAAALHAARAPIALATHPNG